MEPARIAMLHDQPPPASPARWLLPGMWCVYCPRKYCEWAARPIGGERTGCERCGGPLRVAEVSLNGQRRDKAL